MVHIGHISTKSGWRSGRKKRHVTLVLRVCVWGFGFFLYTLMNKYDIRRPLHARTKSTRIFIICSRRMQISCPYFWLREGNRGASDSVLEWRSRAISATALSMRLWCYGYRLSGHKGSMSSTGFLTGEKGHAFTDIFETSK